MNTIDTVQFKHGNQVIKSEQKQGKENTTFDVKSDVPNQYNVNSGTQFKYDGVTHVVQLGITRPNGNQIIKPEAHNVRPNGDQVVSMKTDTFVFVHGEHKTDLVVKRLVLAGQLDSQVDVSDLIPQSYNVNSGTKFNFDGQTHYIYLGVNRPNGNRVVPVKPIDNQPHQPNRPNHPVKPNTPNRPHHPNTPQVPNQPSGAG